jgi:hypothetical protein
LALGSGIVFVYDDHRLAGICYPTRASDRAEHLGSRGSGSEYSIGACDSKQAGEELGVKEEVVSRDLGRVLCKLEELQRQRIQKALEPRKEEVQLSEDERAAAMELLRDPNLLGRILKDFERCGMVGERDVSGRHGLHRHLARCPKLIPSGGVVQHMG